MWEWPSPASEMRRIPVAEPTITREIEDSVKQALALGEISGTASTIQKTEGFFQEYLGMDCLLVSNGSVALMLALRALGLGPGDEIMLPDFTYAATASSVINVGATPVFCDVDASDWNVSLESLELNFTKLTRAIILVDVYGQTRDWVPILDWARSRGLFVIHDCAESFGAKWLGRPTGLDADVSTYSFFANKVITSGEGGMVATTNPALLSLMMSYRGQGMSSKFRYWFDLPGYNFRLSAVQAAMLGPQLAKINDTLSARRALFDFYDSELKGVAARPQPRMPNAEDQAPWMYSIELLEANPQEVARHMAERGVETRPLFYPLSHQPAFKAYSRLPSPTAKRISSSGLSLPTFTHLNADQAHLVVRTLQEAICGRD